MSDVTELVTAITAGIPNDRLIELTNYGSSLSASTVNSTVLTTAATEAIQWFEEITTYDSTSGRHVLVARLKAEQLLWQRTDQRDEAERIERRLATLIARLRAARTVAPSTDSVYERSEPVDAPIRPPFDRQHFDGYRVHDTQNSTSSFPDLETEDSGL